MIEPNGRIVLIDFGASRQSFGGTTTQAFTEAYAPPELMDSSSPGPESDVYELGVLLRCPSGACRPAPWNGCCEATWSGSPRRRPRATATNPPGSPASQGGPSP